MKPQHQAIAAGLALTLAFGTAATPSTLFANTDTDSEDALVAAEGASADGTDAGEDEASEELPAPGDFDRADAYVDDPAARAEAQGMPSIMMLSVNSLMASRAMSISPNSLSSEMKYFAENESGSNYDQGFSYYDGYNAMGFYQFDRRYSLVEFMEACYAYDPDTYAMFEPVIERGDELRSGDIYDSSTKRLTEIGQLAQDAWHAAYAANPSEFSALQDDFAYQEYYLPVERVLRNTFGVDISGRADCVKGLTWGMCNLFGIGGCQKYFKLAELTDDMTDREFVNALCDAVVENVGGQWAASYRARYERERATCLEYIAEDEAQADKPEEGGEQPGDGTQQPGDGNQDADDGDQQPGDGNQEPGDEGEQPGDEGGEQPDGSESDEPAGDGSSSDEGTTPKPVPPANDAVTGGTTDSGPGSDNGAGDNADNGSGSNSDNGSNNGAGSDSDNGTEGGAGNGGSGSEGGSGSGNDANGNGSDADGESNGGGGSDSATGSTDGSSDNSSDGDAGSTGGTSTEGSSSADDEDASTSTLEKIEADDPAANDTSTSDEQDKNSGNDTSTSEEQKGEDAGRAKKDEHAATADERKKLPATADAASIGLAVSAGLSAIGAGAVVAGKKGRGTRVPFEDGFRE